MDPAYHFDADQDPNFQFDANPYNVLKFSWIGSNLLEETAYTLRQVMYAKKMIKIFEYLLDVQLMIFCVRYFKHHVGCG